MAVSKWIKRRAKKTRAGDVTGHVWRAGYVDDAGRHYNRHFERKADAVQWLDKAVADLVRNEHLPPDLAATTMNEWCDQWLAGYTTRRPSSVRQAEVHIKHIRAGFGPMKLRSIKPSKINSWTAGLKKAGYSDSYVHAVYRRLAQLLADAEADGLIARSPISRRTTVPGGKQALYLPTTKEVWTLHDAFPPHLKPAVLLAAFAGLRVSEVVGLRVNDVDFLRRVVTPAVQYPELPLKTSASRSPIPVPEDLIEVLAAHVMEFPGTWIISTLHGDQVSPWAVERAHRAHRTSDDFRFHDLRHYYASVLIASGLDVKTVQARMRHESATTTLNTYAHLWPASDDRTRDTVSALFVRESDVASDAEASSS